MLYIIINHLPVDYVISILISWLCLLAVCAYLTSKSAVYVKAWHEQLTKLSLFNQKQKILRRTQHIHSSVMFSCLFLCFLCAQLTRESAVYVKAWHEQLIKLSLLIKSQKCWHEHNTCIVYIYSCLFLCSLELPMPSCPMNQLIMWQLEIKQLTKLNNA